MPSKSNILAQRHLNTFEMTYLRAYQNIPHNEIFRERHKIVVQIFLRGYLFPKTIPPLTQYFVVPSISVMLSSTLEPARRLGKGEVGERINSPTKFNLYRPTF